MDRFTIVEDACVIVFSKGVYKQCDVYTRNGNYYAKASGGFVRLLRHGQTTVPAIRWYEGDGFPTDAVRSVPKAA